MTLPDADAKEIAAHFYHEYGIQSRARARTFAIEEDYPGFADYVADLSADEFDAFLSTAIDETHEVAPGEYIHPSRQ